MMLNDSTSTDNNGTIPASSISNSMINLVDAVSNNGEKEITDKRLLKAKEWV